jgi:hypothetical protein
MKRTCNVQLRNDTTTRVRQHVKFRDVDVVKRLDADALAVLFNKASRHCVGVKHVLLGKSVGVDGENEERTQM